MGKAGEVISDVGGAIGTGVQNLPGVFKEDADWGDVLSGITGSLTGGADPGILRQIANIGIPLEVGRRAGDYQREWLAKQPKFPMDETGIKFQTAQEAIADPNLRFKPEAQYANVAEGGSIWYADAGEVLPEGLNKCLPPCSYPILPPSATFAYCASGLNLKLGSSIACRAV